MADWIDRQSALDVLHGYFDGMLETDTVCPKDLYGLFEVIPSVDIREQLDNSYAHGYTAAEAEYRAILEDMPHWVRCMERKPGDSEAPYGCLVTVWDDNQMTGETFESLLPYFVGWDGEQWNDADGEQCPFEVIAWMALPGPCREGQDES